MGKLLGACGRSGGWEGVVAGRRTRRVGPPGLSLWAVEGRLWPNCNCLAECSSGCSCANVT